MLLLLAVTLAGGAVITFTPQMVDSAAVAAAGLFLMGLSAALSRWRIGMLADRHGAQRFLVPLVPLTGAGMGLVSWSLVSSDGLRAGLFLGGMLVLGLCLRRAAEPDAPDLLSAQCRVGTTTSRALCGTSGFDAGTALGSVAVGVVAGLTSFATALLCAGAIAVATLPLAMRRSPDSSRQDA